MPGRKSQPVELTADNIVSHYDKVQYRATDGKFYPLKATYPICLKGNIPGVFYLDTGGPMSSDIDFFIARVVGRELQRQSDDGARWVRISPEIRIAG